MGSDAAQIRFVLLFLSIFYPCLLAQFKKKSSNCLFLDLCVCVGDYFCLSLRYFVCILVHKLNKSTLIGLFG